MLLLENCVLLPRGNKDASFPSSKPDQWDLKLCRGLQSAAHKSLAEVIQGRLVVFLICVQQPMEYRKQSPKVVVCSREGGLGAFGETLFLSAVT